MAVADLALFVALASFSFQMLVVGSLDLFGMAGMAVPIGLLIIGMGTAYLPTEFLPAFWQDLLGGTGYIGRAVTRMWLKQGRRCRRSSSWGCFPRSSSQ